MITKKITFLWLLWIFIMIFWFIQNQWLPLGFDHGAYKHFTYLLARANTITELPLYIQDRFEPFSGTFYYILSEFTAKEWLFSWWYLMLYVLTSISLLLLWKNKNRYTIGSFLWLALFLFSTIQYSTFSNSFWKQMFATFFLILLIRYYQKIIPTILFAAACISLHRMTGFLAILFILFSFISWDKKENKWNRAIIFAVLIGIFTYVSTFTHQVIPYLMGITKDIGDNILIRGEYGSGLRGIHFWFYETPLLFMVLLWIVTFASAKRKNHLHKNPHIMLLIVVAFMVIFRCIAHTRLGSFLDLFLIIFITKTLGNFLPKKWVILFVIIQITTWWTFAGDKIKHTPFIDYEEYKIIKEITQNIPKNVTMVTLSWSYMAWVDGYHENEIYSLYQWISWEVWSNDDKKWMMHNKNLLCMNLSRLPGNVFIYVGSKEPFTSTRNNKCLSEVKKWDNNARLLHYIWK